MEIKDSPPDKRENLKEYTPKNNSYAKTNSKNGNPKRLKEKSKPTDGLVELKGGFNMYPSEIIEFSEGKDSEL